MTSPSASQREQRYVFDAVTGQFRRARPTVRFVRPVPYDWLLQCNRLPGKATPVALALWFLAGVKKSMTFRLTAEAAQLAQCSRGSLYHGLDALERAGLISTVRRRGARPQITLLSPSLAASPQGDSLDPQGATP